MSQAWHVTVHRKVGTVTEACPFGEQHSITYYAGKKLTPTGETIPVHNGYEHVAERVLVDAQGRRYVTRSPIDFWGGTAYSREDGKAHFTSRLDRFARDVFGRPLNDRTPPGPAWQGHGS